MIPRNIKKSNHSLGFKPSHIGNPMEPDDCTKRQKFELVLPCHITSATPRHCHLQNLIWEQPRHLSHRTPLGRTNGPFRATRSPVAPFAASASPVRPGGATCRSAGDGEACEACEACHVAAARQVKP